MKHVDAENYTEPQANLKIEEKKIVAKDTFMVLERKGSLNCNNY